MFVLIVDDLGIEYVGDNHLHHLRTVLTNHYKITDDLDGIFFWHWPQVELRKNLRPTHMSPIHEWLHFQPAHQVWTQSSHQTSSFTAPPLRKQLLLQIEVSGRRRHKPQTQKCRYKTRKRSNPRSSTRNLNHIRTGRRWYWDSRSRIRKKCRAPRSGQGW